MAAQMLAGKGFSKIYNLSGGIRAWQKQKAVGPQDSGLQLFPADISAEDAVVVGFGLEEGLRDFYLQMQEQVAEAETADLFAMLAEIEIHHQRRLAQVYQDLTGKRVGLDEFAEMVVEPVMEGGLTTDEYLQLYDPDLSSKSEILSLALAIEAQALDLYLRAADNCSNDASRKVLKQIAEEERSHIARLSEYLDKRAEQ